MAVLNWKSWTCAAQSSTVFASKYLHCCLDQAAVLTATQALQNISDRLHPMPSIDSGCYLHWGSLTAAEKARAPSFMNASLLPPQTKHDESQTANSPRLPIFGSGEMADRIRSLDWTVTALGSVETWPDALLASVNSMLSSQFPTVVLWGPDMITFYNDAYSPLMGNKHPAGLGRSARDVWTEAWHLIGAQFESVLESGKPIYREDMLIPVQRGDRLENVYWTYSYSPLFHTTGNISGLLVVCHDVTGSMRAKREMRESETQARRILQSIGDAVIVTDVETCILRMNTAAEYFTGWAERDARGKSLNTVFRIFDEQTRIPVESPADKVKRLGRVTDLANPTVLIAKDGTEVYIDDSAAPVRDDHGNLIGIVLVFHDVTERRSAEHERAALTTQLEQVMGATNDAIVGIKRDWSFSYLNAKALETYSQNRMLIGKNLWEEFPEVVYKDSPYVEHYTRAMNGMAGSFEAHYPAPFNLDLQIRVFPTNEGIVVFTRDISSEKAAERNKQLEGERQKILVRLLRQQREGNDAEAMMRFAVEAVGKHLGTSRAGFLEVLDSETMQVNIEWVSGSLKPAAGVYDPKLLGAKTIDLIRTGATVAIGDVRTDPRTMGSALEGMLEQIGAIATIRAPILRAGQWRAGLYVLHNEPRTWTAEEISFTQQVADLTWDFVERVRAAAARNEIEERLRLARNAAEVVLWDWDLASGKLVYDGDISRIFGRPVEQVSHIDDVYLNVHKEDMESVRIAFQAAIEGRGEYEAEFRVCCPDGSTHWCSGRGHAILAADSKPTRLVGAMLDITQRKQSEAALRQNEKLAAVGRLASAIAHEMNNPLESVTNLLYLARTTMELSEIQAYLDTAERELRRVSAITNTTLRFHKQSTNPRPATCEDLFSTALLVHQGRLVNAHVQVEKKKRAQEPVLCFDGEIRQVLNNLIGNALDAMSGGGRLLLRSRGGTEWASGRKGLVLTVADTGTGMSLVTLKRMFDAFYTTKGIGGTGLGMWVSKEIIDRHKGVLRVRSREREPHRGTVFTLFLPFEAAGR